jgi:hypothetical protein
VPWCLRMREEGGSGGRMFDTGHDAANREVFEAEPADAPDLVGVAVRGAKKDVDRAPRG